MLITCPNCSSSFRIPNDALGMTGRMLRCGKCSHTWHQDPVPPEPPPRERPLARLVRSAMPTPRNPDPEPEPDLEPDVASRLFDPEPEPEPTFEPEPEAGPSFGDALMD